MRRSRRLTRAVATIGMLVALVGAVERPSSAASTFSASAGGEVVRGVVRFVPPLLQDDLLDPGAVTAQAHLTSFGESTAFASHPYPGSIPVSAPGLIDGLLGMTPGVPPELAAIVNLPEYPLIASSSFPATPSASAGTGPVALRADSRERESVGVASDGVNRTEARIVADAASDVVTASAVSEVGVVDLGPLVQLSGVRSAATVVQSPDGELERTTDFSVASLSVLGQHLRVTADGFELAGLNLPTGLGSAVAPVEQLLDALAEQGTSIRLIEATETADGIISAGLEVRRSFDTGINGIVATVTMTLGRSFADVSNSARPPVGGAALPPTSPLTIPGGSIGSGSGDVGAPAVPIDARPGPAPSAAVPAPGAPTQPIGPQSITALVPDTTDAARFYPVLVLGGAVFVIGISLFRKIGVRTSWMS